VIEHPNRQGWQLTSAAKPDETAPTVYRFKVAVPAKATTTMAVEEKRVLDTTYRVANVTDDQVAVLVRERSLSPEVEQALRAVLAKKAEVGTVGTEILGRNNEIEQIFKDQERLRENLKALGGKSEEKSLVGRYTRQLDEQETRLSVLKREIAEREGRRKTLQAELDAMVQAMAFGK
jgi:predicted  nucleic acid-binding Zn-ribbon protein